MESIAIIPARGGSKRIPRKNVMNFAGKHAIGRTIECARESKLFSHIVVSTDDPEIAEVSLSYGAEVPFKRDKELSDDHTVTVDVILDAITKLQLNGLDPDYVCCIYPVTPLLASKRVREASETLINGDWDYVFGAIPFEAPIERSIRRQPDGQVRFIDPTFLNTRTQDLEVSFHDSGQFYFGRKDAWMRKAPILSGNSTFIELNKFEVIDIDTPEDWNLAEIIYQSRFL